MENHFFYNPGDLSLFLHNLSGDVIWSYSFDEKKYSFVSDSVLEFSGYTASEIYLDEIAWIMPESISAIVSSYDCIKIPPEEKPDFILEDFKVTINCKGGEQKKAWARVKPVSDESNRILGFVGIISNDVRTNDITANRNYFIKLFQKVQVSSPYAVFLIDSAGNIINVNERAIEITRLSRDDLIGSNYIDYIQPDEHEKVNLIKHVLDNDNYAKDGEYRFRTREGSFVDIEVRASAIKNTDGEVEAYIAVVRDITDVRQLERKKYEDEQNLRALLNATTDSVFLLNYEGTILSMNRVAFEWLSDFVPDLKNKASSELIGTRIFDYLSEKTRKVFISERDRIFASPGVIRQRYRIYSRDLDMSYYPVRDADGAVIRFAIYIRDVTDKLAEKRKLKKTEARYRDLVDTMYEGFVIVDMEWKLEYLNRKARESIANDTEQLEGTNFLSLFDEENREILEENIPLALDNRKFRFQVDFHSAKRGLINLLLSISPLTDDKGNNRGFQAVLTDITAMKRGQMQLQYRADFERLITEISTGFINIQLNEIDGYIQNAIEKIGVFNREERIYLFQMENDGIHAFNTHEWYSGEVNPGADFAKRINIMDYPYFSDKLFSDEIIHVPDFLRLPADVRESIEVPLKAGLKSCLILPLFFDDILIGFIGFDSTQGKIWSKDAISLLKMTGVIFVNALDRRNIKKKLVDVILHRLSEREIELLNYLSEGYRWPADKRLLGKIMDVLPGTLDKFMARIKSKMRLDELDQVISYLRLEKESNHDGADSPSGALS